jgi:hypothetical protein
MLYFNTGMPIYKENIEKTARMSLHLKNVKESSDIEVIDLEAEYENNFGDQQDIIDDVDNGRKDVDMDSPTVSGYCVFSNCLIHLIIYIII